MGKRITLKNMVKARIIKPPLSIHVNFKGRAFSAKVDRGGFVLMDGNLYTSLSLAGGTVRAMVSGDPDDGLPYRRVNGWTFWRYTDEKGNSQKMDELRKKYNVP